jgi:hypothetical protein
MVSPAGNLPDREPLRWTVTKAAKELETTEYLVKKLLADGQEQAGADGCFSLALSRFNR